MSANGHWDRLTKTTVRPEFLTQRNDEITSSRPGRLEFCGACSYVHGFLPGLPEQLRRNSLSKASVNPPGAAVKLLCPLEVLHA